MALAPVVKCLGPSRRGLGDEWVERCQVVLDPLHGCQLDSVGVVRDDEGLGEHPWGGFRGLGSICGPQFV